MNDQTKSQLQPEDMFCANEQKVTPHTASFDNNGEFVFTCDCGRFLKFPKDTTRDEFLALKQQHEEVNTGQLSVAKQQEKLKALLGQADNEENQETDQPVA